MKNPLNVLITGATAGIGRDMAFHLARQGHRVFATGRKAERIAEINAEARDLPISAFRMDVTDAGSVDAARARIEADTAGHGVDVLVNNAGFGLLGPMEAVEDSELRRQFDTNVFGLMTVTRAFLPAMRVRGSGRVINVSSMGGRMTLPFFGAYNATKYAVEAMSDALRVELAPFGVRVVLVEPGLIKSEFASHAMSSIQRYANPESPYAPVLARAERLNNDAKHLEADAVWVSRAVSRAIRARRPRARYVVTMHARAALVAKSLLPTRLVDRMMALSVGLTRRTLGLSGRSVLPGGA